MVHPSYVTQITPGGAVSAFAFRHCRMPPALACDTAGNVYVASQQLSYVTYSYVGTIYKVTPGWRSQHLCFRIYLPTALAFDASGNLYVADSATTRSAR